MKKFLIFIVIFFFGWLTSVYLVGNKVELELENIVKKYNSEGQKNYDISVKLTEYKKSFLSSLSKVEIDIIDPAIRQEISEFVKLPIQTKLKINHGPLLFGEGPLFGLMSIESSDLISSFLNDDYKQYFLEYIENDVAIESVSVVNFKHELYNQSTIGEIRLRDNTYDLNSNISISPIKVNSIINLEKDVNDYSSEIEIRDITLNIPDTYINISGLEISSNINGLFGDSYPLGVNDINIESFSFRVLDSGMPPLDGGLVVNTQTKNVNEKLFASGEVDISLLNVDRLGLEDLLDSINIYSEFSGIAEDEIDSLATLFSNASYIQEEDFLSELSLIFNNLLTGGDINYKTGFSLKQDSNKTATFDLALKYTAKEDITTDLNTTLSNFEKNIGSLIDVNIAFKINKDWLNLVDPALIESINYVISDLVRQGFLNESKSEFSVNASYINNQILLNNKVVSDDILNLIATY